MVSSFSIELRFFASLRETLGGQETLRLQAPLTVGELREQLIARGEPYASALARGRAVRAALNQVMCAETQLIQTPCELAFFPPVTGG